ncbi:STAS domain-containing protein [Streptomyces sp. NBC_01198]|uniref:STAS domain-containing protein n=1 Tax=Streptomyces sp. NBC_01198 TaxID=2903769 RepID=UPI002E0F40AC|nr:STAS domain-containing protein [Streptomyces sp. NBC_01198]
MTMERHSAVDGLPSGIPVVAPQGDLDIENLEPLARQLRAAAAGSPCLIIDAAEVTFGDSSLLRVLLEVQRVTELRVARPQPAVRRLIELVGFDRVLQVYPTLEAARTAPLTRP